MEQGLSPANPDMVSKAIILSCPPRMKFIQEQWLPFGDAPKQHDFDFAADVPASSSSLPVSTILRNTVSPAFRYHHRER